MRSSRSRANSRSASARICSPPSDRLLKSFGNPMKLSLMLSSIGVRPRVFGGFALVLSFLVLLAGFAMVQVGEIGGTVNDLVTSAAGDAAMSQVRAALQGADGAVQKFIRTWNVGDKDAASK